MLTRERLLTLYIIQCWQPFLLLSKSVIPYMNLGVMDKIHAGVGSNAIYCLYLQGIKAMNQKTALFVMINTPRRMDAS